MMKILTGATLGTAIALSSFSSAFAADTSQLNSSSKAVAQAQTKLAQGDAKTIALKNCGCEGVVKSTTLKGNVYHVTIHDEKNNQDKVMQVNAKTGKVVKKEIQSKVTVLTKNECKTIALQSKKGTVENAVLKDNVYTFTIHANDNKDYTCQVNAKTGKVVKTEVQKEMSVLSKEESKAVALQSKKGTVKKAVLKDNVYTFTIHANDNKDYTCQVNAKTGKVVKTQVQKQVQVLTQTEVKTIALENCNGTVNKITKKDNVYHVSVKGNDNKEHVFQINAKTGACVTK